MLQLFIYSLVSDLLGLQLHVLEHKLLCILASWLPTLVGQPKGDLQSEFSQLGGALLSSSCSHSGLQDQ